LELCGEVFIPTSREEDATRGGTHVLDQPVREYNKSREWEKESICRYQVNELELDLNIKGLGIPLLLLPATDGRASTVVMVWRGQSYNSDISDTLS
jgi:hypothetical protein